MCDYGVDISRFYQLSGLYYSFFSFFILSTILSVLSFLGIFFPRKLLHKIVPLPRLYLRYKGKKEKKNSTVVLTDSIIQCYNHRTI